MKIPITGIASDFRVPGAYAEILMAQGNASAALGEREVCLCMPMLSTGTWTAATLYEVANEQAAIDGAGTGSPLARAARKFLKANKQTKLWALPVAETTGGSPVAGTFAVTWTTDPTASGETSVKVLDETLTYSFTTSDTVTTIAAGMSALINTKTHLPVTAANASGVMTVTARLKGISQGNGTLDVIPVRPEIDAGVGTTVSAAGAVGDTVAGAEGSTAEAANLATSLATIDGRRIYYLVSSANDATSYTNLQTHLSNKSEPDPGLRSVGITAYTGGLTALQTIAKGRNYERLQIAWQEDSDHDMAEIAANVAAIRAKHESTDPAYNFAGYSKSDWLINKANDTADWPTKTEQNDAITDGIAPIASNASTSYLVMSVNTRSKTAAGGTVDDFRACETHRLSVCDAFVDKILDEWALNYQGKKLADDVYLADGTVDPNQKRIRGVLKPSDVKTGLLVKALREYEELGLLQNVDASIEGVRTLKCDTNAGRIEGSVDLHVIDHAHQFTVRVAEVSDA